MSNVSNGTDRASAVGSSSPVLFIKGSEPDSLKLFVRNLPTEDVTADEVAKAFASYGTVVKVKVRLINGQQPTGNAEVEIEDPVSAFKNDMVNGKRRYVSFRNTKVLCHLDNIRMDSLRQSAKLVRPALNEDEITMDRIALGAFVEQDVFYEQWECTHDVKLSVDYFNYQEMKVEFSRRGHLFKLVYRFKK
ncbi:hypothetical protein HKX48_004513 [Thoreauomyces humboldtii]|nr:hypothetical protein HKX48_004513 [Thoreauomyces humboldtii]